mgnify:FL=1
MIKYFFIVCLLIATSKTAAKEFELAEQSRLNGAHELAIKLYEEASKSGNPLASHWAGTYYLDGVGVKQNSFKAHKFFLHAAQNGIDGSMIYLANMYLSGNGVSLDCKEAIYWLSKSFGKNIPKAWQQRLSDCENSKSNKPED